MATAIRISSDDKQTAATTSGRTVAQVVFIDARVPDLATLVHGAAHDAVVHVLAPGRDGVAQIAEILVAEGLHDLGAVAIVAHGAPGAVEIGSTHLDGAALRDRAQALAQIGAALGPHGSLLLYACDVGRGEAGARFVADLSRAAGAPVAAASHPVGAAALGGTWDLDIGTAATMAGRRSVAEAWKGFRGLLPGGTGAGGGGGQGGSDNPTGSGNSGGSVSASSLVNSGGGGGGAGTTGGAGGKGGEINIPPNFSGTGGGGGGGGAGAVGGVGGNGDNGGNGSGIAGGGGGGGGAHGFVGGALPLPATIGGNGGNGGNAGTHGGGGGGAGGVGAVVTAAGALGTLHFDATGGRGGNGGNGNTSGGGGTGGIGLLLTDASGTIFTVDAAVTGGAGGTGNPPAAGGAGIVGQNLTITLADDAAVTGGMGGNSVRANAITFTGGTNTLTLESGATITGNVVADDVAGTDDALALGGSAAGSFDVASIGASAQYRGFEAFRIDGGTWSLSGTTTMDLVVNGGTLAGSATLGNITLHGGMISPGNSPAVLATGSIVADAAATFNFELGGTDAGEPEFDQLQVTGTVSLGNAALTVAFIDDFTAGYEPGLHDSFRIIDNDGTDAVTGTFAGLPEGAVFMVDGVPLRITYRGGDGNDVVLVENSPLVVDTLVDENDGDYSAGDLSLREALALANSDSAADTITFAAGLVGGSTRGLDDGHLTLTGGQLVISSDVTIEGDVNGDDAADITIDANRASRVLDITAGAVTLDALVITGGWYFGNFGFEGGGLRVGSSADVTVIHSEITGNSSESGGGIANRGRLTLIDSAVSGNSIGQGGGGGISNSGTLTVIDSVLANNRSFTNPSRGGGLDNERGAVATLIGSTVSGNEAAYGGGIHNQGHLTLTDVTLWGNTALRLGGRGGGGLASYDIYGSSAVLTNVTITGNHAWSGGGILTSGDDNDTLMLTNTIVAGNQSMDGGSADVRTFAGTPTYHGGNIVGDTFTTDGGSPQAGIALADIFASLTTIDPPDSTSTQRPAFQAGALADNGGAVQTVALKRGGAAHNAGDIAALPADDFDLDHDGNRTEPLPVDARGLPRVDGPSVDLGAFELQNAEPVVADPMPDQVSPVNVAVNFTFAADAFTDADNDTLAYSATLLGGAPLPAWLTFDGPSRTFSGTPPQNFVGDLDITVMADDGQFAAEDTFRLTISNAGNDVLVSGTGAGSTGVGDIFPLVGGAGDDTYAVADEDAEITEQDGGDTDTVYTSVTYTMAEHVEGMVLTEAGGAIDGTGSDGNDTIFGNSFTNWLSGGEGTDALVGGGGNDVLIGGAEADGMAGGTGDDTYVVDNTFDQILENPDEGTDTVYASATFALFDNVEGLVLVEGAGAIDGTGSASNDTIIGNSEDNVVDGREGSDALIGGGGNDVLIGGAGIDGMAGGRGDDTYGVDDTMDQIQENADEGADTVYASASFMLVANVESLVLVDGAGAIDGSGNGGDNYVFGNSSDNMLHGGGGNDVMFGGAGEDTLNGDGGNDVLTGGGDDDSFVFGAGFGRDSITDFTDGDHIVFSQAVFADFAAVQAHMVEIDASTTAIVLDNDTMLAVHHAPGVALTQNDFLFG